MGDLQGKYHVIIDDNSYILARNRNNIPYYTKRRAPHFVSKFGSGDSSYRDATFWQFWAQTNWRNGAQQLKFDDFGKFWKSENIDTTELERITLSNNLESAGQTDSGVEVKVLESWRAGTSNTAFGDGSDGSLTISSDTTESPIDSSCSGTSGSTSLSATNASFASGQKIMIIQMRGTGAGNYEINEIDSYSTGTITTDAPLSNTYTDSGASQAQVRVLEQYSDVTISNAKTWTAKAWDGNVGGVLAFLCTGDVTVSGTISADTQGFLGGASRDGSNGQAYCGEGTGGASATQSTANGNGGGGGNESSGAGGGHANAGAGGQNSTGGSAVGNAGLTTIFMGGGGGGANSTLTNGDGGEGGGIIYIAGKTITVTGGITADGENGENAGAGGRGGGGGGGGSILLRAQNAVLGTNILTVAKGTGGTGDNGTGGDGSVGRMHLDYLNSFSGSATPSINIDQDQDLADNPPDSDYTGYAGTSAGKIYSWDGGTIWTEAFDCRRLEWYDDTTVVDDAGRIGDDAGTEYAQAQSFQLDAAMTVKAVELYLKWIEGTPGDITVRIETDSTGPSGTLVDAAATTTISSFTDSTYAWYEANFATEFTLSASTTYWIVAKTAAAANDNHYVWGLDAGGGYGSGAGRSSSDGGSTWGGESGDVVFRVKGPATSVNCSIVSDISGTNTMYFGVGDPDTTVDKEARIYEFDGTTWSLNKIFSTTTSSQVLSMEAFNDAGTEKVFVGVGPQAIIYETEDFSTYTSSKDIKQPARPGYPWVLKEYNRYLYALGGTPELIPNQKYNGFVYVYDTTEWNNLYPFTFTVLKSAEFYDAYLFMGTYHGQIFVFDTASLNPIFDWKELYDYQVQVNHMYYYDDNLYVSLTPQENSNETNTGIWLYDRHGMSLHHKISNVDEYGPMSNVNNVLLVGAGNDGYVYKLNTGEYASQGWVQSSYYDANLPSINKLYNEIEIKHDPLSSGDSVVVYYKFKEADDWTTLGTSDTEDAESATFSFTTGTYSKQISLKYELNSGDNTTTPEVTDVIMKYSLFPDVKWKWDFRVMAKESLKLRDRTTSPDNAATIRSNIETSLTTKELLTFTDVDGTDYTVLLNDIDESNWVHNPDTANENLISVSLIEA